MHLPARLFILATFLCLATPAPAAPTCQDRNGNPARCGTPQAMPLGWSLSPEEFAQRQAALHPAPDRHVLLDGLIVLVLFLAFLALLPDFDGRHDEDWYSKGPEDP